jgi:hypothetical protein
MATILHCCYTVLSQLKPSHTVGRPNERPAAEHTRGMRILILLRPVVLTDKV